MKRMIGYILITAALVLQLGGCGADGKGASEADGTQDAGRRDDQEISVDSGGILDPSAVLSLGGKDNSMDACSATVRVLLQTAKPENALPGGGQRVFLSSSGAYYLAKHLFQNVDEGWDELIFMTAEGEMGSERFERESQLWDIGPAAGTEHYVVFDMEAGEAEEDNRYFLTERDENHKELRTFPLNFLRGSEAGVLAGLSGFAVDKYGTAHLVLYAGEEWQYLLVSQEGEILAEYVPEDSYSNKLVPLYDGRVAIWSKAEAGDGRMTLQYMDAETGRPVKLAALENMETDICYLTLFDEETLLYADKEGVYCSGLSGENPEILYRWSNHGIIVHEIAAMQADEEGRIALIYKGAEDYNYLCLEPVTEEVEICQITMAVPSYRTGSYQWAAAEFNKRYPSCHIELVEYEYNDTTLLTQLTTGKGPVLIDTFLVNFKELEKLWEPLDGVMEQLGILEDLQPSVMEMGKINGNLYGIVTNFALQTLVVRDPALKDWDYDTFIQCVEDSPELEALFNLWGGNYGSYFIMSFLSHGFEDNYFLDEETGRMTFDSSKFRKALELAKKYCVHGEEEVILPGSSLLEGKVFCNTLSIQKPEELALYRVCYGEDANFIGFPTKDGAAHLMSASGMLSICRTATKEEKEAAAAFISVCLSHEAQSLAAKDVNFALSPRRDVLEEQIAAMNGWQKINISGFDPVSLGDHLNIELDRKTLLDMIDKAKPVKYFPSELREIMFEELDLYFSGSITEDMLIDHLESRVGLYLDERR